MQINKEKRQALVEFLTPDDATKALSFDGRLFLGTVLRIRRPKDYVEMPVRYFWNYYHVCYLIKRLNAGQVFMCMFLFIINKIIKLCICFC